ncbi:MAG: hypothetical protein LRY53_00800 [Burkholderiaceae bacterium]|nr:hypothetical protein [Burkholderiaceae bacterium]MCD8537453.1 hypothetical protein [Burkholderiaceae bacterium]MCD8564217.1 hypothetical protein [Burkholderiaceae bacterium]
MKDEQLLSLTESLLHEAVLGLGVLVLVVLFSGSAVIRIAQRFSSFYKKSASHSEFALHARFIWAILQICIVQMLAIGVWTLAVYLPGLVPTALQAFLFVGSCYTTLGIFSDILPTGWKALAFYIAFSGLFSFALTTSVLISMITLMVKPDK